MAIEFYSFGTPHPAGVEEHFKKELSLFMKNVNSAKVFFIHNPRISNMLMTDIDLLLILAVEKKQNNFHKINKTNINNVIIPIKFIYETVFYEGDSQIFSEYNNNNIYEYNVGALVEEMGIHEQEYSYQEVLKDLGWQSKKYLEKILGYKKITTHPIIWIITDNEEDFHFGKSNILKAPKFGFRELTAYFYYHPNQESSPTLKSVDEWNNNYRKILADFEKISSCMKEDSYDGSLTKKKIKIISKAFHNDSEIYEKYLSSAQNVSEETIDDFLMNSDKKIFKKQSLPQRIKAEKSLENNIVIINGKAGSGKTSELYLLMKKCYEKNKLIRFLTYNQMLRNDAQIISNKIRRNNPKSNEITVKTIQQLIYAMADRLGILVVMNQERLRELQNTLVERKSEIMSFWQNNFKNDNICIKHSDIKFNMLTIGSNRLLRKFLNKRTLNNDIGFISIKDFPKEFEYFIEKEGREICESLKKNIFLTDYFGILKFLYSSLFLDNESSEEARYFWKNYESVHNSPNGDDDNAWQKITQGKRKKIIESNTGEEEMVRYNNNREDTKMMVKRSLGQFKKYVGIIDEGQDFHELERDILLKMSESKNIVVATGGKEQLIRFDKECRWDNSQGQKIAYIEINKRNTSFRMKERIINLCNFIADKFDIDLKLTPHNNKDKGRIFISTKKNNEKLFSLFNEINNYGQKHEHSRYENIMFLLDTQSEYYLNKVNSTVKFNIDEHDNVRKSQKKFNELKLHEILGINKENIWLHNISFAGDEGAEEDDDYFNEEKNSYPNPQQHRVIYYESCRGLEAWAVMCFDIDLFYDRKKNEDAAALFCSDDLLMTESMRRSKYAATQVLMALTRAIDTLYIEIKDPSSELGKIIMEYIEKNEEVKMDNYFQDSCNNDSHEEFDDDIPF